MQLEGCIIEGLSLSESRRLVGISAKRLASTVFF